MTKEIVGLAIRVGIAVVVEIGVLVRRAVGETVLAMVLVLGRVEEDSALGEAIGLPEAELVAVSTTGVTDDAPAFRSSCRRQKKMKAIAASPATAKEVVTKKVEPRTCPDFVRPAECG